MCVKRFKLIFLLIATSGLLLLPRAASAYIDPNTGGFFFNNVLPLIYASPFLILIIYFFLIRPYQKSKERKQLSNDSNKLNNISKGSKPIQISAIGKFDNSRIKNFDKHITPYHGKGKLEVEDAHIKIYGRVHYPFVIRIMLFFVVFFLLFTLIDKLFDAVGPFKGNHSYYASLDQFKKASTVTLFLSFIISAILLRNVTLQRQNISISWDSINKFTADPKRELIAISFSGSPRCSPIVFKCSNWSEIHSSMQLKIPNKEISL